MTNASKNTPCCSLTEPNIETSTSSSCCSTTQPEMRSSTSSSCCTNSKEDPLIEKEEIRDANKNTSCCSSTKINAPSSSSCCSSKSDSTVSRVEPLINKEEVRNNTMKTSCCSSTEQNTEPSTSSSCCSGNTKVDDEPLNEKKNDKEGSKKTTCCSSSVKSKIDTSSSSSCCSKKSICTDDQSFVEQDRSQKNVSCCSSGKKKMEASSCLSKIITTNNDSCRKKDEDGDNTSNSNKRNKSQCISEAKSKGTTTSSCCSSKKREPTDVKESSCSLSSPANVGKESSSSSCCASSSSKYNKGNKKVNLLDSQSCQKEGVTVVSVNIAGMTCAGCSSRIENFLLEQKSIDSVSISLLTHHADIYYDPDVYLDQQTILDFINGLGFSASLRLKNSGNTLLVELRKGIKNENLVHLENHIQESLDGVEEIVVQELTGKKVDFAKVLISFDLVKIHIRTIYSWLQKEFGKDSVRLIPSSQIRSDGDEEVHSQHQKLERRFLLSIAFAIPVIIIHFILPAVGLDHWKYHEIVHGLSIFDFLCFLFTTPIQVYIAKPIYESAFSAIYFSKRANMDVLIALSTSAAYIFSICTIIINMIGRIPLSEELPQTYFEVPALLVTFILLGRVVEQRAKIQTSESIQKLLELQVKSAILLERTDADEQGGKVFITEKTIEMELIQQGDHLKVFPGARVPTDGRVVSGKGEINESMITGESRLVPKSVGDEVIGGTINQSTVLEIQVTKGVNETLLAQIVTLVENAQTSKPEIQRIADIIASYFTVAIISLATIMFIVWFFLAHYNVVTMDSPTATPFGFALRFAITILVISCPCAISLAVPTVVMVATGVGARIGLLIRGGRILESLPLVDTYVFDKTGTLTTGKPKVVNTIFMPCSTTAIEKQDYEQQTNFWTLVASAESNSEHPLGQAIVEHAREQNCQFSSITVTNFENQIGSGISCLVDEQQIYIGKLKWLQEKGKELGFDNNVHIIDIKLAKMVESMQSSGCTIVYVAFDKRLQGIICLQDTLREEAKYVVNELQSQGRQVWMITGDHHGTGMSLGRKLGIEEINILAEATPAMKIDQITELQAQGKVIAFIGDGINDSPALAAADIGIAVGCASDVAKSTADIILVKNDLRDILNAQALSLDTVSRIRWNFIWGILYNLIMMPIASGALYVTFRIAIPPAFAGLSELLSSVPVILMSLLLNFFKPKYTKENSGLSSDYGTINSNAGLTELSEAHDFGNINESTALLNNKNQNQVEKGYY